MKAHAAGATVVHIYARNPQDSSPSPDLTIMRYIVSVIKQRCNAVICVTNGGAVWMTSEQRLAPAVELKPELASCNAGSVNFVYSGAAEKLENPKYEWEIPHLKRSDEMVFTNTFTSLEYYIKTMNEHKICPEFEVYDIGIITNSGLVHNITDFFISVSTHNNYSWIIMLYTAVMDFFVPSAGSKFAIGAPYIVPAGTALGVKASHIINFQDIIPYTFVAFVYFLVLGSIMYLVFPIGL